MSDMATQEKSNGYRYVPQFECEAEVRDWLEEFFENQGWTALTEVSPHNSRYRADLLVQSPDSDVWIGLELKYMKSNRCGAKPAEALRQITQQYTGKRYLGEKVHAWCFVPYYYSSNDGHAFQISMLREWFCYFGVGILNFASTACILDFGHSSKTTKVEVGVWPKREQKYSETRSREFDTDWGEIERIAKRKQSKLTQ